MTTILVAAVIAAGALLELPQDKSVPSNAGLRVVVIAGEDAVNIIQQKTAVAPIVEVRDRNNQPVAGAIVTFSITSGQNASFSGGLSTLSLTTNAAGRAAVAGMTPMGAGSVQINVAAAFQGQTATVTISQSNFFTAAQAASASGASTGAGSGGGGGGGIGAGKIIAIGAGVAAAGAGAALVGSKQNETATLPTVIAEFRVDPSIAALATPVQFSLPAIGISAGAEEGATVAWDFGDGERTTTAVNLTSPSVHHTYLSTGTFTASATIRDGRGGTATRQASVTVKSLTGRWTIDVGGVVDLVQAAAALTGTYTTGSTQTSGTLSGVVGPGEVPGFANFAPGVTFTITANNRQQLRFVGSVADNTSVNGITGGIGTPSGIVVWRLTRQ